MAMAGARFSATDIRLLEVDAAFAASSPPNEDKVLNASWQRCRVNLMSNALAHATGCHGNVETSWGLVASDEIVQQGQLRSSTATLPKNRTDRRRCVIGHR